MSAIQIVNKSLVNKLVGNNPDMIQTLHRLIDNADAAENVALGDIFTRAYMDRLDNKERTARPKSPGVRLRKAGFVSDAYTRHTLEYMTDKNQFEGEV